MLFSGVTLVKQRDDCRWYCYQQLLIEYTPDLYAMAINWRKHFTRCCLRQKVLELAAILQVSAAEWLARLTAM